MRKHPVSQSLTHPPLFLGAAYNLALVAGSDGVQYSVPYATASPTGPGGQEQSVYSMATRAQGGAPPAAYNLASGASAVVEGGDGAMYAVPYDTAATGDESAVYSMASGDVKGQGASPASTTDESAVYNMASGDPQGSSTGPATYNLASGGAASPSALVTGDNGDMYSVPFDGAANGDESAVYSMASADAASGTDGAQAMYSFAASGDTGPEYSMAC